jgi:ArsR family transcriptional regulator
MRTSSRERSSNATPLPAPQEVVAYVDEHAESDQVFEAAAEIFKVMSSPMRLKIIRSLCNGERNVTELLDEVNTTQPNMSQHLNTLYRSGIVGKRKDGVQIFYRITNERVVTLCRAVCTQIAIGEEV